MKSNLTKLAAAGALTLSATAGAMAGSVTQPGETAGLGLGAPLPPGFYFVDTTNWGVREVSTPGAGSPSKVGVGVTIPVIAWSTPWKVFGARVEFFLAAPALEVGVTGVRPGTPTFAGSYAESMYNPFIGGTLAWDLGSGWGFAYGLGYYFGVNDTLADKSGFITNRASLSYTANGWNLTASAVVGTATETVSPIINPNPHPDYLDLDLTATKTIGKWEVGAVGFYSTDLDDVNLTVQGVRVAPKQSQFAAGALVGYDWGAMKTQVWVTRDVWQEGYGGYDTRVWGRVILPLGDPFAATTPMYHK
jgi:hypothetical protein